MRLHRTHSFHVWQILCLAILLLLTGMPVRAQSPPQGHIKILCAIDEQPVADQTFHLSGDGITQTADTDTNGIAEFSNLPDGSYTVRGDNFSDIQVTIPFEGSYDIQTEAKHEPKPDTPDNPKDPSPEAPPQTQPETPTQPKPEIKKTPINQILDMRKGKLPQTGQIFYPIVLAGIGTILFSILYKLRNRKNVFLALALICLTGTISGLCYNSYWNQYGKLKSKAALEAFENLPDTLPGESKTVDNKTYIGKLSIPKLDKKLPIQNEWTDKNGKISPCRYKGSAEEDNLIIAGHSSAAHFGYLLRLKKGDKVTFTDASGTKYEYRVKYTERIKGTDKKRMEKKGTGDKDWDLTLFTCTTDSRSRITVRLGRTDN